jgi:hypothetical protein
MFGGAIWTSLILALVTYIVNRVIEAPKNIFVDVNSILAYCLGRQTVVLEGEIVHKSRCWSGTDITVLFSTRFNATWAHIIENMQNNSSHYLRRNPTSTLL